jgi:hypothetical protein
MVAYAPKRRSRNHGVKGKSVRQTAECQCLDEIALLTAQYGQEAHEKGLVAQAL